MPPTQVVRLAATIGTSLIASGVATSAAQATELRERVLASASTDVRWTDQPSGLTAGFGHVAWQEGSVGVRSRVVVYHGKRLRRGPWRAKQYAYGFARRVDLRTGGVVVRLQEWKAPGGYAEAQPRALLSPRTLKPTKTEWPALPADVFNQRSSAVDGAVAATATNEPDPNPPAGRLINPLPATACRVAVAGSAVVPPVIPDCTVRQLSVVGSLVALTAYVPSQTNEDFYSSRSVSRVFDLDRPALGWRQLDSGLSTSGKGGSSGLQTLCVLDTGVAVLEGGRGWGLGETDPSTWTLTFVGRNPSDSWTAPAPQLAADQAFDAPSPTLACSGSSLYALISTVKGRQSHRRSTRVVELTPRA